MLTDQMTSWAAPRRAGAVLRLAAQARALSALTKGDFEAAYQAAATITRPGELADHVPHAVWMTLDLTEAAVRTGRQAEATAHVKAVQQASLAGLSPRHLTQSMLLAAAGHTNKEIAARLFLSPRTVSTHLHRVFPKLGIASRAALRDALAGPSGQ